MRIVPCGHHLWQDAHTLRLKTYGAPQAHGRELRVCAGGTLCHADDLPFRPSSTPSAQGAQLLPLLH